jgi:hypothetical protein
MVEITATALDTGGGGDLRKRMAHFFRKRPEAPNLIGTARNCSKVESLIAYVHTILLLLLAAAARNWAVPAFSSANSGVALKYIGKSGPDPKSLH